MKPLSRTDSLALNLDIAPPGPYDEQAKRGHAIASAMNAAIKSFDATARSDAEESEEEKRKKETVRKEDQAKKDAEGTTLDKILKHLDGINSRMDALEKARADGAEAMIDKKKKDAEEREIEEKGESKELAADKKKDSAYTDAIINEVASAQTAAERACSAWGTSAEKPMMGEYPDTYRRRTAKKHQCYSDAWRDVDLGTLHGQALAVASKQIFADSFAASSAPDSYDVNNGLRETRRVNKDTGHVIREYYGQPMAWMQQFTGGRRLAKFNLGKKGDR